MNISTILDMAAEAFGERVALVCGEQRYTYAELRECAVRAAARIKASGAAYVALLDVASPAAPIAIYAAAYAAVPYVPLNYRLTVPKLHEVTERIAPALPITKPEKARRLTPPDHLTLSNTNDFFQLPSAPERQPIRTG